MEFTMIAVLKENNKIIGVRLLDRFDYKTKDYDFESLKKVLSIGSRVTNISIKDDKIVYTQGAVSRYPKVHIDTGKVELANSLIVIDKDSYEKGRYKIVNYRGAVDYISEEKLVEYSKKHITSNCKIVCKGDTEFMASIRGKIETEPNLMFKYNRKGGLLKVYIMSSNVSRVEIPKNINNKPVDRLVEIIVVPKEFRYNIKYVSVPETLREVSGHLGEVFPNLQELRIKGVLKHIDSYGLDNLEILDIEELDKLVTFLYLPNNIKEVRIRKKPEDYKDGIFADCKELNTSKLFYEGLTHIGDQAFRGMEQLKDVSLPASLITISSTAFLGCKNMKSLRINNNFLNITAGKVAHETDIYSYIEMFDDAKDMKVYCSSYYPVSKLRYFMGENVEIVEVEDYLDTKDIDNKIYKATALGYKVRRGDLAKDVDEAVGFLMLMDSDKYEQRIRDIIRKVTSKSRLSPFILDNQILFMEEVIPKIGSLYKVLRFEETKNYYVIVTNDMLAIILKSKDMMINILQEAILYGNTDKYNMSEQVYGDIPMEDNCKDKFVLGIPVKVVEIKFDDIAGIRDLGRQIRIKSYEKGIIKVRM